MKCTSVWFYEVLFHFNSFQFNPLKYGYKHLFVFSNSLSQRNSRMVPEFRSQYFFNKGGHLIFKIT